MAYLDLSSHQPVSVDTKNEDDADSSDDMSLHSVSSSQVCVFSISHLMLLLYTRQCNVTLTQSDQDT